MICQEEGPEHNNRNIRYNREHHARQTSLQVGLLDAFRRDCHKSDPKILRILEESIDRKDHSDFHLTQNVLDLLEDSDDKSNDSSKSSDDSDS